jgi:hypothetical protein
MPLYRCLRVDVALFPNNYALKDEELRRVVKPGATMPVTVKLPFQEAASK